MTSPPRAPQSGQTFANYLQGTVFATVDTNGADTSTPVCEFDFEGKSS